MASAPSSDLSAREATKIALYAQAMRGPRLKNATALVPHLRAVQLDTISVLARSQELIAYARLGAVPREKVEAAYWGSKSETFEYWSHAACVLPLELWPAYARKRRARTERGFRWHQLEDHKKSCRDVIDRLRRDGPLTAQQLGGAKKGGVWWDWSEVKIAAEWLLDTGEVVCRERRGFARVYDLAERAIPVELLNSSLSDDECSTILVESALRAMGIATMADIAAYHGMHVSEVRSVLATIQPESVNVKGWRDVAYVSPKALEGLGSGLRGRNVLLSPFDSLLWDRARLERLFAITYRLEAYVPAPKRVVGYFAMPILHNERIVGLVDPKRVKSTLHARHIVVHTPAAIPHIATALQEAASWVGCDDVLVERVSPTSLLADVQRAVSKT